jgi:predicted type IV restriction endonuclease
MPIPDSVKELVERFRRNRESYQSARYNETQLRREFVDPLFEAMGWDVNNRKGYAEAYKDVVHEDSIRIAGAPRSPDYSFRIGGLRKFFVETKKPSVNLRTDPGPAFQLRRYAWSAKLPISVLTDFEEFVVYDTRRRPSATARPSEGRILYFTFEEYEREWDRLVGLLSPEAIRRGELDRFAQGATKRRGVEAVDDAFLLEIEEWREMLAKNFALRNDWLTVEALNFVVQMTVDRIVFLRIAEDRALEDYGQLQSAAIGDHVYSRLLKLFEKADERYNSGLFHFARERGRPGDADTISTRLEVDDKPLREIINRLYYPASPYEFSVLPADILGQVYERFLGKVIRLTAGHRAVIDLKPEVRKQGGVFYTPTYVVSDLVSRTIGPLLAGRKPAPATRERESANLKVLDPACGSGSFLLGAYQYLLDWHFEWYVNDGKKKWTDRNRLARLSETEWRLTTDERKRILLDCLFGVDVDAQAVEVTKLSLLLKVLEGETQQNVQRNLDVLQARALPDLDGNIRQGNSLIESDFITGHLLRGAALDTNQTHAFNWREEFRDVFERKNGGFDVVLGNPPYVLLQELDQPEVAEYLAATFQTARYKIDTYHLFLERGVSLLRDDGKLGYITPSSYLRNKHAEALREFLLSHGSIDALRAFYYPVFKASVDCCEIVITRTDRPDPLHEVAIIRSSKPTDTAVTSRVAQSTWMNHSEHQFGIADSSDDAILRKIEHRAVRLGEFATAYFGIQTNDRTKYVAESQRNGRFKPVIDGVHIGRYRLSKPEEFVDYRPEAIKSGGSPLVYARPRIGVRQIGEVPVATLLPPGLLTLNTIYNIYLTKEVPYDLRFVLGILLSAPLRWYWRRTNYDEKRTFPKIKKAALLSIPIPMIDFSNPGESRLHDAVVKLVDEMLLST